MSQDKLVLVVSHDREFAERYGDRVIELADGKIISDITKHSKAAESLSKNISIVDDKILQVNSEYELSEDDVKHIVDFLKKNSKKDIILSVDGKSNNDFRKIAKLDERGNQEVFKDTTKDAETNKNHSDDKPKFIKSKLPFKNAFKIGASSLKVKPFRLVITLILCIISFTMFGMVDTFSSYNRLSGTSSTMIDNNVDFSAYKYLEKEYDGDYINWRQVQIDEADAENFKKDTGLDMKLVYGAGSDNYNSSINLNYSYNFADSNQSSNYYNSIYNGNLAGIVELDESEINDLGFNIIGVLPSNFDEIAITDFTYSQLNYFGYKVINEYGEHIKNIDKGNLVKNDTDNGIINKYLRIQDKIYKITAVINTKFDIAKFDKFLPENLQNNQDGFMSWLKQSEMTAARDKSYHNLMIVKNGFVEQISANKGIEGVINLNKFDAHITSNNMWGISNLVKFDALVKNNEKNIIWVDGKKDKLKDNEIIISIDFMNQLNTFDAYAPDLNKEYIYYENGEFFYKKFNTADEFKRQIHVIAISDYSYNNIEELKADSEYSGYTDDELRLALYVKIMNDGARYQSITDEYKIKLIFESGALEEVSLKSYSDRWKEIDGKYKIVGCLSGYNKDYRDFITMSDKYTSLFDDGRADKLYSFGLVKNPQSKADLEKLLKYTFDSVNNDSTYFWSFDNEVTPTLNDIGSLIISLSQILIYVALALAVFSALMMANYIAISITDKKREIGILRAVGARSSDVFGIFFYESLIIALITFVFSTFAVAGIVTVLNTIIKVDYGLLIKILIFGIRQIALILGISILVAFISSIIPVYKISKKRPIDAIQGR